MERSDILAFVCRFVLAVSCAVVGERGTSEPLLEWLRSQIGNLAYICFTWNRGKIQSLVNIQH